MITTTTIPNSPDNYGWTPIHEAARYLEIVELLMTATDAHNVSGKNPSDLAREFGYLKKNWKLFLS